MLDLDITIYIFIFHISQVSPHTYSCNLSSELQGGKGKDTLQCVFFQVVEVVVFLHFVRY